MAEGFDAPAAVEEPNKQLQQPTEKKESSSNSSRTIADDNQRIREDKEREREAVKEGGRINCELEVGNTRANPDFLKTIQNENEGFKAASLSGIADESGVPLPEVRKLFDKGFISTAGMKLQYEENIRNIVKGDMAGNTKDTVAFATGNRDLSAAAGVSDGGSAIENAFNTAFGLDQPRERTEKLNGGRDIDPAKDNVPATVKNYEDFLKRNGTSGAEAAERSKQLESFLNKSNEDLHNPEIAKHLQGTPEQEMARMCKAMNEVMESREGPLTQTDRANLVMGMAARSADADTYGNQGQHKTCALESLSNSQMTTRRAEELERVASVANKGGAYVGGEEAADRRWVSVNEASRVPDFESQKDWNSGAFRKGGERDIAGQMSDALYGQLAADLQTSRMQAAGEIGTDQRFEYFAAHLDSSRSGYKGGQDATNEGLTLTTLNNKNEVMSRQIVTSGKPGDTGEGPQVGPWQVAELNTRATGNIGGVMIHQDMLAKMGKKPAGMGDDVGFTTYTDAGDHTNKLSAYQERTGQAAQILVNAPYLKGGTRSGHGLHAMTEKMVDGQIRIDNQWGDNADAMAHSMNAADIDKATNPAHWDKNQPDWRREKLDPDSNRETRDKLQEDPDKKNKDEKERQEKAEAGKRTFEAKMSQWERDRDRHNYEQQLQAKANKDYQIKPFDQSPPTMSV